MRKPINLSPEEEKRRIVALDAERAHRDHLRQRLERRFRKAEECQDAKLLAQLEEELKFLQEPD